VLGFLFHKHKRRNNLQNIRHLYQNGIQIIVKVF
jgi:hypothetical protein